MTRNRFLIAIAVFGTFTGAVLAQAPPLPSPVAPAGKLNTAAELMEKQMYRDAIRLLEEIVKGQGDDVGGVELRMLAECYYLEKDYAKARPLFSRALPKQTSDRGKMICESRLAMTAYRLKDYPGAEERIDNFLRKYPTDSRVGTLHVIRLKIVNESNRRDVEKLQATEAIYQTLASNKKTYGYYNVVLASQILGELYIKAGRDSDAIHLFTTAVHEMRGLITEFKQEGRAIPSDLMQGVDSMSLQIAEYHIKRKDWNEAFKWLENVAYQPDLVQKSKLLLAQIAYQRQDYAAVIQRLPESFLKTLPSGSTRSGMCLLLGYAHRETKPPDPERAKQYLKLVEPGTSGYRQAQHGLGDIYREQKDDEHAEPHYLESVKDPKYAPSAHFALGMIYKARADVLTAGDPATKEQRQKLLTQAAAHLRTVVANHPLTVMAKEAEPVLQTLAEQGTEVVIAAREEDKLKTWQETIKQRPGTSEAAQALVSLAEYHSKTLYDIRGVSVVKAPDWSVVATACQTLLSNGTRPFENVAEERWRELRARCIYLMALAELGSLPPGPNARRRTGPQPVPKEGGGSAQRAVEHLQRAADMEALRKDKDPDFLKDIEFAAIEAMFKTKNPEQRAAAEKRYAALEAQHGKEARYQRLEVMIADWFAENDVHEPAARIYRKLTRQSQLERDEVMHLLYLAGIHFNKAGKATGARTDAPGGLGIYIYPKEIIKTLPITKTYEPFGETRKLAWSPSGADPTALEALKRVSQAFGQPFVWSGAGGVDEYLQTRTIPRQRLLAYREDKTLEEHLELILDMKRFQLDFDLGATGGQPTVPLPQGDGSDLEETERKVLEIYDTAHERFTVLAREYGVFSQVHGASAMMFNVIRRIEAASGARVSWADGVEKEDALAQEYRKFPGLPGDQPVACRAVLDATLPPLGLTYKVIRRDLAAELIGESSQCFNELRNFGMDTAYAERAMFFLAVNFFYLKEYEKMKLILREHLKTFDSPAFEHFYDACFWLGWCFERERDFREAIKYYTRAAEESVVLYRRPDTEPLPPADALRKQLSYDTLYSLSLKANGSFDRAQLGDQFVRFVRFNSNVQIALDPTVSSLDLQITRPPFVGVECFELLYDAAKELGLGIRAENGNPDIAEKTYFRLATVYKRDNLMYQALDNINTLLTRFPKTRRRVDALKLKLDVFKAMKDYTKVLAVLEELRAAATDEVDAYKIDYETGRVYFDMCNYEMAEKFYARVLSGAGETADVWHKVREALAHLYARRPETWPQALNQFEEMLRYETSGMRRAISRLMIHLLRYSLGKETERKPLPEDEAAFIARYEAMSEEERNRLGPNDLALVTWIYYVNGMEDVRDKNLSDALKKLDAAANSPDPLLAGEAMYQVAQIQMQRGEFRAARDTLQHLLFAVHAVEPSVRATYQLAVCHEKLGNAESAFRRYKALVDKFPLSPFADLARKHPLYIEKIRTNPKEDEPPAAGEPPKA